MGKGTYALIIALERDASIAVGRLGQFAFPAGYYIYVGSARSGLPQRVRRHLKGEKRLRWHVDYLLEHAKVVEVWCVDKSQECLWACAAKDMPQGQILVPGFGSSDCRCPSHLIYFPLFPSLEVFQHMLAGRGSWAEKASPLSFL